MFTLAAYVHDLSPFLLRLGDGIGLRWYGLSYVVGVVLGWLVIRRLAVRGIARISPQQADDLILALILGIILGGRLGYVAFYEPHLLTTFTTSIPFWGVLQLNKGGMASHGGMIGVIVAAVIWLRRTNRARPAGAPALSALHVLDLCVLAAPIGLALGRIANFINSELLGRVVAMPGQPAPWWSVKFPKELLSEHAVPLTLDQTRMLAGIVENYRLPTDSPERGLARMIDAVQHGARDTARQLEPLLAARHPSQLYAALSEGVLLLAFLWLIAARPRKPGVIGAWFLIGYGVVRIGNEFFRMPDAGIGTLLGLSRGQQLSALMVLAGIAVLVIVSRQGTERIGGWLKRPA